MCGNTSGNNSEYKTECHNAHVYNGILLQIAAIDGYSITSAGKLKTKGSDTIVARSSTVIFQGVICCFLFYGAEDYSAVAKGRLKSCNGIEAAFSDGL